jgi:two-component system NtrC family sensor kinase
MPGESGVELIRYVRAEHPDLPVIMITALDDPETVNAVIEEGVYTYIVKPFTAKQLLISISNTFQLHDIKRKENINHEELMQKIKNKELELCNKNEILSKIQDELQESEDKFRLAIEHSNEGVAIVRDGVHVYVNEKFAEIFGYDFPEEIMGKPLEFVLHPDESKKTLSRQKKRQKGENVPSRYATKGRKKNGETIFFEISASRTNFRGEPVTLAFIRDVTEQRKAESLLRQSEEKFRAISESAMDAIIIMNHEGVVTYWNRSAQKIFGYHEEEIVGQNLYDLLVPERLRDKQRQGFMKFQKMNQDKVTGVLFFVTALRKDGSEFPIELSMSSIFLENEWHAVCIVRDQSERKAMETSLLKKTQDLQEVKENLLKKNMELEALFKDVEKAKQQWESTMDCIEEMVILVDSNYIIQKYNKAFKKYLGLTDIEIIGKDFNKIFAEANLPGSQPGRQRNEYYCKKSDKWFIQNISPYEGIAEISNTGFVTTFTETTKLKLIAKELENKNRELADNREDLKKAFHKLQETQAQIIQQEKMASIGQLAAGVAHEINNPIGFISSNLKTLEDYQANIFSIIEEYKTLVESPIQGSKPENMTDIIPRQIERIRNLESELDMDFLKEDIPSLIEESREGTERIKKIVADLKDFAHPGKHEKVYSDINLNLDSTLNIVWNELKYKATVSKDYGDLPQVLCYPQQMNQVFMNILVNAGQAIETQGEINISTRTENGHVKIQIGDTGPGMPPEIVKRIFEPFFTTKEVGKGTGLGLNMAYNIVKKHQGTIDVQSVVGKGTTFTIQIPVGKAPSDAVE